MRGVIVFLIAAAAVVAVAWAVSGISGTVSATIGDTVFETSAPIALLVLFVLVLLLALLLRLLGALWRAPRSVRGWRAGRNRQAGETAVTRALLALAAGDGGAARREADRARRLLGDRPLTLLLAANAARQAGRDAEATVVFRALAARGDASFLGLRGLLRMEVAQGRWQEAAELARRAEAVQPGAAWLRDERAFLAVRTGQWREALRLAGPGAPRAALAAAAAQAETDPKEARRLAKQAWESDPSIVPAALAYARDLRGRGKETAAQDVMRKTWAAAPHPDVAAFALDPVRDPLGRVRAARLLSGLAPDTADTHLLLARTYLEAKMLGEARRHAEAARAAGPDQQRVWLLASDIAEAEGNREGGREALRRAAVAEPDPAWQCTACGALPPEWSAACPTCATPGRIAWVQRPGRSSALPGAGIARLTHTAADTEQLA